jgi:hypothetical protein
LNRAERLDVGETVAMEENEGASSSRPAWMASASGPHPSGKIEGVNRQEVVVTDVQMNFGSMVLFVVKWAIASIPALLILWLLGWLLFYTLVRGVWG